MSRNDPIHIKASRKGTFTKAATAHHMSDTQFEGDVLSHPDKFSPAMERRRTSPATRKSGTTEVA